MLVATLQGSPAKEIECEIRVGLGPKGVFDIGWVEPGFELVDPCFELCFEWGFGFGVWGWRSWG